MIAQLSEDVLEMPTTSVSTIGLPNTSIVLAAFDGSSSDIESEVPVQCGIQSSNQVLNKRWHSPRVKIGCTPRFNLKSGISSSLAQIKESGPETQNIGVNSVCLMRPCQTVHSAT